MAAFVHPTADVDDDVKILDNTSVWHLVHLRKGCHIGSHCVIGRGAFIDEGVVIGNRVKVQNFSMIYSPAIIEDDVFIGPAVVLTNDKHPRSSNPDQSPKTSGDWPKVGVTIRRGASLGARSVCVAPVEVGEYATVGAGAVVTKDVPAFALVTGVPARQVGWVGHDGIPLTETESGHFHSASLDRNYRIVDGSLQPCE